MDPTDMDTEAILGRVPDVSQSGRTERRRYFRVADEVALRYRVLTAAVADQLREKQQTREPSRPALRSRFAVASQRMEFVLSKIEENDPDVARCLATINEKLDLLAGLLAVEDSDLAKEPTRPVDLSAVGVCFPDTNAVDPGSMVEIELFLTPSLLYLALLGKVVRCEPVSDLGVGFTHRIAVEFETPTEELHDLLIQHIMQKQVDRLRQRQASRER